eukprot:935207-Rhodomonas_salina.1
MWKYVFTAGRAHFWHSHKMNLSNNAEAAEVRERSRALTLFAKFISRGGRKGRDEWVGRWSI